MMPKQTEKVRGHVVITVAGRQYGDPIPMDRDKIITVKHENGAINRDSHHAGIRRDGVLHL